VLAVVCFAELQTGGGYALFSEKVKDAIMAQEYDRKRMIQGVEVFELKRHNDEGGALTELLRITSGESDLLQGFTTSQINYSTLNPGYLKAFHVHPNQTDVWFVPPEDKILLMLVDVRKGSATESVRMRLILGDGNSRLVRIPPGVAHGAKNLSSSAARIIYFVDRYFDSQPDKTEEYRLPWDYFGKEVWEAVKK
jgi:dTDP-4-dehydrorhamnose 3,5-epimerase